MTTFHHLTPTFDQCRSPTQYYSGEQCASEVHVRLLDSISQDLVDPRAFISYQVGSEQQLWSAEPGRADLKNKTRSHFRVCGQDGEEVFTEEEDFETLNVLPKTLLSISSTHV